MTADGISAAWQSRVFDLLLQHNVTQFAYVSDAGHKILIDRSLVDPRLHSLDRRRHC